MSDIKLSDRERKVLRAIIEHYVRGAKPISSRAIVDDGTVRLSSATVRNVMRSLEERGLVSQPHTSAGRVPTDIGYRFYVDNLMQTASPSVRERERIVSDLERIRLKDYGDLASGISRMLSELATQLAVAVAPADESDTVSRIELLPLDGGRALVVCDTSRGSTRTSVVDLGRSVSQADLADCSRFLNARISGAPVRDVRAILESSRNEAGPTSAAVIRRMLDRASGTLYDVPSWIHCEGARFILRQPEFSQDAAFLGEIFDHEESLARLVRLSSKHFGVNVTIGGENPLREMRRMSIVVGTYRAGSAVGRLGVIGPTRMRYSRLVGLVGYLTGSLEELLA